MASTRSLSFLATFLLSEAAICDDAASCAAAATEVSDASLLQVLKRGTRADEPNPPDFGKNVFVVAPGEGRSHEAEWADMYNKWRGWDDEAQFGDHRTAVLLQPGNHSIDIDIPYYFSVIGLGDKPTDVRVTPGGTTGKGLRVDAQGNPNSDNTFWRTIENLEMDYPLVQFWVSQAAPLRSVKVDGNLELAGYDPHWASGGAMMNSYVTGSLSVGTQQQWYTRGSTMPQYPRPAGPGSYVCVGCVENGNGHHFSVSYPWSHPQKDQYRHTGRSSTAAPEVFAEKPHIVFESSKYYLSIPQVQTNQWGSSWGHGVRVPFEQVYVASPGATASTINAKLSAGKHVVFTPGIYKLSAPIVVNKANAVLLGIGFATLQPDFFGDALIKVGNVDGVRIGGLLLQAGRWNASSPVTALLQWGAPKSTYAGKSSNPGFIYDLVGRVGGPEAYETGVTSMVEINNGWVIGDDLWLWSADHCVGGIWPCPYPRVHHSLVVNGENVRMYGLMAEHSDRDIVVWNGENGQTEFFQAEFRYTMGVRDHPPVEPGHSTVYRVNAKDHRATGFGIYCVVYYDGQQSWALSAPGGFSAITVKHRDTYEYGFKDTNAANWNIPSTFPVDSRINCKVWDDDDQECIDTHIAQSPR